MEIEVRFTAELPEEATTEQIQEWLEFNLGARGEMSMSNPLHLHDITADQVDHS